MQALPELAHDDGDHAAIIIAPARKGKFGGRRLAPPIPETGRPPTVRMSSSIIACRFIAISGVFNDLLLAADVQISGERGFTG